MAFDPETLPGAWPPTYPLHRAVFASEAGSLDEAAKALGLPALTLMEHAARGVARVATRMCAAESARFVVLCGPGDNGGDGYGVARFLRSWMRHVDVVRLATAPPASSAAATESTLLECDVRVLDGFERPDALVRTLEQADLIVDAIFGVGLSRPLDARYAEAVERVNAGRGLRLAVDIPSGMHADTGLAMPVCVQAHVTATMAVPKRGFAPGMPGVRAAGRVVEIDIGLPFRLHAAYLARPAPAVGS